MSSQELIHVSMRAFAVSMGFDGMDVGVDGLHGNREPGWLVLVFDADPCDAVDSRLGSDGV